LSIVVTAGPCCAATQQSVAQALASSVGVKVGSYPADLLRRNLIGKACGREMEIDKVISDLKRQRQTNRISAEDIRLGSARSAREAAGAEARARR
jgi:hypothetical protein